MNTNRACVKHTVFFLIVSLLFSPLFVAASPVDRLDTRVDRAPLVDHSIRAARSEAAYSTDEIIVKYENESRPHRVRTNGRAVADVLAEQAADPNVEYAEPNYIMHAHAVPNDPYYDPYQWHFDNDTYGGVHAEAAWDITTGEGVIVAVIDTGVAYENYGNGFNRYSQAPDLAGTNFVPGYDFVNNDSHPNDDAGHGTHVAGTIAGTSNNSEGVAGLAYGASIMPIKVLDSRGSGSYADVADGVRFAADNGANVINLSLGGPVGTSYLEDALRYAHEKGVTIVASSGNENSSSVSYPAAYNDYVIAVGATRLDEERAPYSNRGSALDIVAPGGDTSVDQNGDGYGDGVLQQTFGSNRNQFGYYFYQGTSMAAPHAAAAAALVIASGKATTPAEVQTLLQNTAEDLGAAGRDNTFGYGLIDLEAALSGVTPTPDPEPQPDPNPTPNPEPTPNQSPIANAGPDQTRTDTDDNGFESVTLSGASSTDPDGSITTYDWYEGTSLLGSGETFNTTLAVGVHTIELIVTDDQNATSSDSVVFTIEAGTPPPPPPVNSTLFSDSFESGLTAWTQGEQLDWKDSGRQSSAGDQSAEVDGRAVDSQLISPLIATGGSNVVISFDWFIERSLDAGEYLAMDISTDGGATWAPYRTLRAKIDTQDVWHAESITLSGAASVQLRFRGTMSSAVEDAYVDNVIVETTS